MSLEKWVFSALLWFYEGFHSFGGWIDQLTDSGMIGYPLIISFAHKYPTWPAAPSDILVLTNHLEISNHPIISVN